jgi:ABC-2 type transport system ATP-binding protein
MTSASDGGARPAGPAGPSFRSTEPAILTEGLAKDYGRGRGLRRLDLEVRTGEIFGFLGPNGAGKTTTIRLLLDLIRPTGGHAQVLGLDSRAEGLAARRRIGYLPGDLALPPRQTGAQLLDHLARLRGGVDRKLRDRLAERFGAELDRPVRQLSSGNRQKLGLVQAFMHEPELVILDEPIAGLDPLVQQEFHQLLAEVRSEGRTVFLSSHTLSEVERVTDRVAILRRGELVIVETIENLRAVAVQRLELDFAQRPALEQFRSLPGVRSAELQGCRLRVSVEGSVDALLKHAAQHEVLAVRSHEADLEEIFLGFYRAAGENG